jgi:hypothetical protein
VCAAVNCKVQRLAVALLLVVPIGMYKVSINIASQNKPPSNRHASMHVTICRRKLDYNIIMGFM